MRGGFLRFIRAVHIAYDDVCLQSMGRGRLYPEAGNFDLPGHKGGYTTVNTHARSSGYTGSRTQVAELWTFGIGQG